MYLYILYILWYLPQKKYTVLTVVSRVYLYIVLHLAKNVIHYLEIWNRFGISASLD